MRIKVSVEIDILTENTDIEDLRQECLEEAKSVFEKQSEAVLLEPIEP